MEIDKENLLGKSRIWTHIKRQGSRSTTSILKSRPSSVTKVEDQNSTSDILCSDTCVYKPLELLAITSVECFPI